MATLAELQDALVNADRAGDKEAARQLADAIVSMQQTPPSNAPKMSKSERFWMGLADPIQGGAQLLTHVLPQSVVNAGNQFNNWLADKTGLVAKLPDGGVDQQTREREAAYQQAKPEGFDWMRMAGNVLSPANVAIASSAPAAVGLKAGMGIGAGVGAASSALAPVTGEDFANEKLKQIAAGAAGGAAAPVVAAGFGRVISPKASVNPDVAMLRQEGVQPTVGQMLGGRWNALEEKAQSIPIMGDAIALARKRSLEQFNKAALNRATSPVGQSVDDIGQAGVSQAGDALSAAYDVAKSQIGHVKFDRQFSKDLTQLRQMSKSLTPPMQKQFDKTLKEVVGGRTSAANAMLGDTFKKVDSELGQKASRYGASTVASEQELGDALKQLQSLIRQQAERNNPAAADAMRKADAGWANLVRLEGASKAAANSDGVFTPGQLNTAIRIADKSVRKRAVARGEALMQDLGSAGQNVLGNKIPNSFTTDRALVAGGGLGAYLLNPAIPISLGAGAAAYSPPAQALLRGLLSRPTQAKAVAELLNQSSPMLAPGTGLLGTYLLNQ